MDITICLDIAKQAATNAGAVLMSRFHETHAALCSDIRSSGVIVDSLLKAWFSENGTDTLIISEEEPCPLLASPSNHSYSLTEYKRDLNEWNGYAWIIDPICGSIAYERGIRDFVVSIALVCGRDALLGVVYDPPHDEMFCAVRGGGAFLNGEAIRPSEIKHLSSAVVSLEHKAYKLLPCEQIKQLACEARRLRTAMTCGLEMCYVACGRIDAVIKLSQAFYDYIAGALILSESLDKTPGLFNIDSASALLPYEHIGCTASFIGCNGLISTELSNIVKLKPNIPTNNEK